METTKDPTEKAERYARAEHLYFSSVEQPDVIKIAEQVGVNGAWLAQYANRKNWPAKRSQIDAQRSALATGGRALAIQRVDALAVQKVENWFVKFARHFDDLAEGVLSLPINATDPREKRMQLAESIELANDCVKGAAQLVEAAKSVGLVLGPKDQKQSDKGLDLSKLTSLSLTLIEAQKSAGQTPIEPIKIEPLPAEPEY